MFKILGRKSAKLAFLASAAVLAAPVMAHAEGSVQPEWGNLRPFYGNLHPFYGNLRPFYGNLRPFWGNLRPFWDGTNAFYGDLSLFWGVTNPVRTPGAPDYASIGQFWTTTGDDVGATFTAWSALTPTSTAADYQTVADRMKTVVEESRTFWGGAIQAKTGKSFDDGFAKPIFAKYGLDPSDPASFGKLSQDDAALFFLDWYDGLMAFSGADRVDHWMKTANWSPTLSMQSGYGAGATVGLLDMTVVGDNAIQQQIVKYGGISSFTNGHGVAVASLIAAAHDGQGVMGIAPKSNFVAYNPFDATGTADWDAITKGIHMLKTSGAGVVNASLGVPGETLDEGWNKAFTSLGNTGVLKNTVFVIAAGNDGVTQNNNLEWNQLNPAFLVVGSVDMNGNISNFSNRPGTSCLTTGGNCLTSNQLMNHFVVAPGELILVDDGHGGVTRASGTSFAAPIVSGAIALIQGRWPWLVNAPNTVVNIILSSAKDLGAPGPDPVYGRGLLDITAAMSPLDFNKLVFFSIQNGRMTLMNARQATAVVQAQSQKSWDANNTYFSVFEPLGLTLRDFEIPLSSKLVGQTVTTLNGKQMFQAYLTQRMDAWAGVSGFVQGPNGFAPSTVELATPWGPKMSVSFAPRGERYGFVSEGPAYQSSVRIANERSHFTFGVGDGAAALARNGFLQSSDYDPDQGGANPLLGLASGGGYAAWTYDLAPKLQLTAGAMARSDRRDPSVMAQLGLPLNGAATYDAQAAHAAIAYTPVQGLTLTAAVTRLREDSGLLGMQSFDPGDLRKGSTSDGVSLSASWRATPDLTLAATGSMSRTRAPAGQALTVDGSGVVASAYEAGVTRTNLFAAGDRLQVSVSQPLHVEDGKLAFTGVEVIDRRTGEIGPVTHAFDIAVKRRLAGEVLYMRPLSGQSDFAVFGRVEDQATPDGSSTQRAIFSGVRYRLSF